jgi:hypothetical protein
MGFPLPPNSPQITIGTRTVCAAAFDWPNPIGNFYKIGIFEMQKDGSWNAIGTEIATYCNPGDCIGDMKAKGGSVKYLKFIVEMINAQFVKLFAAAPPPVTTEPTTDDEAKAWITASFGTLKLTNVNGVPVLG